MKKTYILALCFLCVTFTACDIDSLGGYTPPKIDCKWDGCNTALFANVYLYPPCSDGKCDYDFKNSALDIVMDGNSMIPLFEYTKNGLLGPSTCHFVWVVSVIPDLICENTPQSQRVELTEMNYSPRLCQYSGGYDALLESPSNKNIQIYDHKHDLTIQLFNVTNWSDGSEGTITWHFFWEHFTNQLGNDVIFALPPQGWVGDYKVTNNNNTPRHIYINGLYKDI